MPKLLNFQDFCEDLKEITTTKIMNKKKFHPNGLFSEQIFGPLRNYTCQCGTYYGISQSGSTCKICEVDIMNSDERRKRFAKIVLPISVVNPIFYDLLITLGGNSLKNALDELMKNEKSVLYMDEDDHVITTNLDQIPKNSQIWEKNEAIQKIVSDLAINLSEDIEGWKIIKNNLDKLIISQIIVLPPDLRPAAKGVSKNSQIVDKINRFYMQILTKKESMRETIINVQTNKNLYYTYFKQIQKDVNELYHHILEKISKKEGLIRGNILGKRIDFSGRAVIVPDPTLKLDECVLPYKMVLEIFKLQLSGRLIEIGKFKLLNKAISFVDECIENSSSSLLNICKEITKDKVCILNRQPSLHRLGMLGFKIKVSLDSVIKIHPLICHPLNADFDGDSIKATISYLYKNKYINCNIEDLQQSPLTEKYKAKTKDNGTIISKYKILEDIFIKAIDPKTGNVNNKKITEFSVHENIKMYKIHDTKNRFKDFHSSYDHSLIIYDENEKVIKEISPKELLKNPNGKYFIKKGS